MRSQYVHDETYCDGVWYQEAYQRVDRFSREDLARLIAQAEGTVAKYLGYWPLPRWITEEEHQLTQFVRVEVPSYLNSRGMRKSLVTRWGHVLEGGVRATTLIEEDVTIVYSGTDYTQTATITISEDISDITDAQEIRVFYPDKGAAVQWEIRPVTVDLDAGTVTFKREQCVLESLLYRLPPPDDPLAAVDGDDDANFLTAVDVYRVYTDDSQQVVFYEEPTPCEVSGTTQDGYVLVRDARRGFLAYDVATYADGVWTNTYFTRPPLRAKLWYRAGKRNLFSDTPELQMDYELERLLIYYALTLTDKEVCGCENFHSALAYQLIDLAELGSKVRFQTTYKQLDCPLGTKRAAINMWTYIQQNKLGGSLNKGV